MKKKRSESFFGIHFDFHAMPGQTVAEDIRPDLIARLLDEAKPDFVQCDTKGHAGLSSYPTDIGNRADAIKNDPLEMWRRLTEERDIALYVHHSGLYDMKIAEQHPDWAVVDAEGKVSDEFLSPFSPYVDEILIPQMKEMYDRYRVDGVWVDGECWGLYLDYGKYATEAYLKKTGKQPARIGEDGYEEYREFCREGFRAYVDRYVKAMKEYAPEIEITSNWFYSAHMPEAVSTHVDFLSGDYNCAQAVESARFHTRCLETRDMTWDLMMWGQHAIPCSWTTRNRSTKELVQYCQEAAGTIAHGGAFQFFNIIYCQGGVIQEWAIPMWAEVAKFCRARQEVCFGAKVVPEIAILYSEAKTSPTSKCLYTLGYPELYSLRGWINLLQDAGMNTSVLYEYQLREKLSAFPLLVIPSAGSLTAESISTIDEYVKNGGKIIIDRQCAPLFEHLTGIKATSTENRVIFLDGGDALAAAQADFATLTNTNATVCARAYGSNIYDNDVHTAALKSNIGKGAAISLATDLGDVYMSNQSSAIRSFARSLLSSADFEPTVRVSGESSDYVEAVVTQKDSRLIVNLLNTAGPHAVSAVRSYGQIPPLYNITVDIRSEKAPIRVISSPEPHPMTWKYSDDTKTLTVSLSKLDIHTSIVPEY